MQTTIFLINGYQIKGQIRSFDNFTILLDVEGRQQLVYKHAVSTIIPFKNIAVSPMPADPIKNP
jgi:host factor-I protein